MNISRSIYRKMYLIRKCELIICEKYNEDKMFTPMHMSWGEEGIVAPICQVLLGQYAFGYYRSHALFLGMTESPEMFFLELCGKAGGSNGGRAGSMHFSHYKSGLLFTTAVVGTQFAPAVGAAYSQKIRKTGKIVASFFGDGACEEGVFHESLNLASILQVPVIFILLDNGIAIDVPAEKRRSFKSFEKLVNNYGIDYKFCESSLALDHYKEFRSLFELCKRKQSPVFYHGVYSRYLGHIGITRDTSLSSRLDDRENIVEKIGLPDPVAVMRNYLVVSGLEDMVDKIEKEIDEWVEKSIEYAYGADSPRVEDIRKGVYADE